MSESESECQRGRVSESEKRKSEGREARKRDRVEGGDKEKG